MNIHMTRLYPCMILLIFIFKICKSITTIVNAMYVLYSIELIISYWELQMQIFSGSVFLWKCFQFYTFTKTRHMWHFTCSHLYRDTLLLPVWPYCCKNIQNSFIWITMFYHLLTNIYILHVCVFLLNGLFTTGYLKCNDDFI